MEDFIGIGGRCTRIMAEDEKEHVRDEVRDKWSTIGGGVIIQNNVCTFKRYMI